MGDADVHVIDRGALERDTNYVMEGHVLASHAEPDPDRAESDPDVEYGEIPVRNRIIDHPEETVLRDTGSHHDAEQFEARDGWGR